MLTTSCVCYHLLALLAAVTAHQPTAADDNRLGQAITRLGLVLADRMETPGGGGRNFVLSPYSAHVALSQLALGAAGRTAEELQLLLGLPPEDSSWLHSNFTAGLLWAGSPSARGRHQPGLQLAATSGLRNGGRQMRSCNLMVVARGFQPLANYTRNLKTRFGARLQEVDLIPGRGLTSIRNQLNSYVKDATGGQIGHLLPPSQTLLGPNTRMVLLNAVHFAAFWQHRFDARNNFVDLFERRDGSVVKTTFMSTTLRAKVRRDRLRKLSMLELPYNDGGVTSLLVILPFRKEDVFQDNQRNSQNRTDTYDMSCKSILQRLAKFRLDKRGHAVRVAVQLPRFRLRQSTDLKALLQAAGLTAPFLPSLADFSGISATVDPPLFVSDALQETVVEVDEAGTEAAAATTLVKSSRSGPFWFMANRPFVFVIYDYRLGAPLFLGQLEDPSQL
jgi:serpin B